MGSIQLADGCTLKTKPPSERVKLDNCKSPTETILERGSAIEEARVARESVISYKIMIAINQEKMSHIYYTY